MRGEDAFLVKIYDEFTKFERMMEEMRLLKNLVHDIQTFRKMMKLKKFD